MLSGADRRTCRQTTSGDTSWLRGWLVLPLAFYGAYWAPPPLANDKQDQFSKLQQSGQTSRLSRLPGFVQLARSGKRGVKRNFPANAEQISTEQGCWPRYSPPQSRVHCPRS